MLRPRAKRSQPSHQHSYTSRDSRISEDWQRDGLIVATRVDVRTIEEMLNAPREENIVEFMRCAIFFKKN